MIDKWWQPVAVAHEAARAQTVAESVDYRAVRNVLTALAGRPAPSALMTTIGTTDRKGSHEWKQRGTTAARWCRGRSIGCGRRRSLGSDDG